ncbi:MAG: ferrous iron transport protein A [Candidatus Hydrogenedentota bacterium]
MMASLRENILHLKEILNHIHKDVEHITKFLTECKDCKWYQEMIVHINDVDGHIHNLLEHTDHLETIHFTGLPSNNEQLYTNPNPSSPVPLSLIPPNTRAQVVTLDTDKDAREDIEHIIKDIAHMHNDIKHMCGDLNVNKECPGYREMITHIKELDEHTKDVSGQIGYIKDEYSTRLTDMGIWVGSIVEVVTKIANGPILLAAKDGRISIDFDRAKNIKVIPLVEKRWQHRHRHRRGWFKHLY